jgi:plastocyanin
MKRIILRCFSAIILVACFNFYGCKKCDCPTAPPKTTTEEILMLNTVFSPAEKMITKGTTVKWTNQDPYAHTVTSDDNVFNSGNLNQGQTFEYTFNTPGTYDYHCIYHAPGMKGRIIVH